MGEAKKGSSDLSDGGGRKGVLENSGWVGEGGGG